MNQKLDRQLKFCHKLTFHSKQTNPTKSLRKGRCWFCHLFFHKKTPLRTKGTDVEILCSHFLKIIFLLFLWDIFLLRELLHFTYDTEMLHIKTKLHLNSQMNTKLETKYVNQNILKFFFVKNLIFYFIPVQIPELPHLL